MDHAQNRKTKIAIVDDHNIIREYLLYGLTLWDYAIVIEACNGRELLDKLSMDNLPDICILDLNMPVLNGHETIKILKKTWPCIKILVYSMEITKQTLASSLNVDAVVSKEEGFTGVKKALQVLVVSNN
ncbi:hypothetical protein A4H97_23640 [Niastella yeongjuensis]|uniref:Response regulatory domain-containing protein n=1 Tax=Niastella yeongjuensis TaxID=354355 RepID=A0A1V9F571_9BACT|nr:response regulator transcription factor [Niastella yeongjuensis]OQP53441.1 hypothetical protein A4H97_23640 [Niastella yeongjuensis]SEP12160.1 Response regulator receiver domain-containing protein [Niastella yeongjuensis]